MKVIGLMRVRNEQDVIVDSLKHLESFCDDVIVFDDCSTDNTRTLIENYPATNIELISGEQWNKDRQAEETLHRAVLLKRATQKGYDWCVYLDADERLDFDVRATLAQAPTNATAVRFTLFDGYLTPGLDAPYEGGDLASHERLYGPEYRRIIMAWRNSRFVHYIGRDKREPTVGLLQEIVDLPVEVMHYGKAMSIEKWEEKCDYYVDHFPEPYTSKWKARKGKALHELSDFGEPLVPWREVHDMVGIDITPPPGKRDALERLKVTVRTLQQIGRRQS